MFNKKFGSRRKIWIEAHVRKKKSGTLRVNHFDIKSYLRTDLLSHMSQDQLMDFSAVCSRLDIEMVIFLSDFFFPEHAI